MTKEEILAGLLNHNRDVTNALGHVTCSVDAMVRGYIPPEKQAGIISALKDSLDYVKDQADGMKVLLGQWPS